MTDYLDKNLELERLVCGRGASLVFSSWGQEELDSVLHRGVWDTEEFASLPKKAQHFVRGYLTGLVDGIAKMKGAPLNKVEELHAAREDIVPLPIQKLQPKATFKKHANGGGWISDTCYVSGSAYVGSAAVVYGDARVSERARVYGSAQVSGSAEVYGAAHIHGRALVRGEAKIYDAAKVLGEAIIEGSAEVGGISIIRGKAHLKEGTHLDEQLR
jgi:hypothetical protein